MLTVDLRDGVAIGNGRHDEAMQPTHLHAGPAGHARHSRRGHPPRRRQRRDPDGRAARPPVRRSTVARRQASAGRRSTWSAPSAARSWRRSSRINHVVARSSAAKNTASCSEAPVGSRQAILVLARGPISERFAGPLVGAEVAVAASRAGDPAVVAERRRDLGPGDHAHDAASPVVDAGRDPGRADERRSPRRPEAEGDVAGGVAKLQLVARLGQPARPREGGREGALDRGPLGLAGHHRHRRRAELQPGLNQPVGRVVAVAAGAPGDDPIGEDGAGEDALRHGDLAAVGPGAGDQAPFGPLEGDRLVDHRATSQLSGARGAAFPRIVRARALAGPSCLVRSTTGRIPVAPPGSTTGR